MIDKLLNREINAEIIATIIFMVVSGLYLFFEHGASELINDLFRWMFPASVMIFLTLILVKVIEYWHNKAASRYRYVNWGRR
jgi:hypothetical protein